MIIAIIGPDGSGKTTIAELLVSALERDGFRAQHYPFNFGYLPKLSAFRIGNGGLTSEGPAGYDLTVNSSLRSLVYITWYSLDYLIGGTVLFWGKLFDKTAPVAVFARYYYDYYYQSNNRRLPDWVKSLLETIVPRPSYIFFLDRDAQEIHDGKPELPVDEIARQQCVIVEKLSSYPQFHTVDARSGAENTLAKILAIVRDAS